jgi:hypothetical protein
VCEAWESLERTQQLTEQGGQHVEPPVVGEECVQHFKTCQGACARGAGIRSTGISREGSKSIRLWWGRSVFSILRHVKVPVREEQAWEAQAGSNDKAQHSDF